LGKADSTVKWYFYGWLVLALSVVLMFEPIRIRDLRRNSPKQPRRHLVMVGHVDFFVCDDDAINLCC
jgi:hypothetical protein